MSDACALCIVIKKINLEECCERTGSASTHYQDIRFLAIGMLKVLKCAVYKSSNCKKYTSV